MRSLRNDESGAVMVLVSFVLIMLMGFGALVVDVGALYQERRVLQNGADAAALAVAADCAGAGCGTPAATAAAYADANSDDGTSSVPEVCGQALGLAPCASPPALPAGILGYVRATTATRAPDGGGQVTFKLATVLGLTGSSVGASATVAWGSPLSVSSFPLTISKCEYDLAVVAGRVQPGPTYSGTPSYLFFKDSNAQLTCPGATSGGDLPGGFGWIGASSGCATSVTVDAWVGDDPGVATPSGCDPTAWRNQTVLLPIHDQMTGTGSNGKYHVVGFTAFHITGYQLSGGTWPSGMACLDEAGVDAGSSSRCFRGYFTEMTTTSGDGFGGPDMGVTAIRVAG